MLPEACQDRERSGPLNQTGIMLSVPYFPASLLTLNNRDLMGRGGRPLPCILTDYGIALDDDMVPRLMLLW